MKLISKADLFGLNTKCRGPYDMEAVLKQKKDELDVSLASADAVSLQSSVDRWRGQIILTPWFDPANQLA